MRAIFGVFSISDTKCLHTFIIAHKIALSIPKVFVQWAIGRAEGCTFPLPRQFNYIRILCLLKKFG